MRSFMYEIRLMLNKIKHGGLSSSTGRTITYDAERDLLAIAKFLVDIIDVLLF